MTLKEYQRLRIVIVMVLAMAFSQAIILDNYLIPIALLVIGSLALMRLRSGVKEVIADERDWATGGRAALLSIQLYSWVAVGAMFIFYGLRDLNPAYEPIGMTLAFSTTILMLTYAVIFRYFNRFSLTDKKLLYTLFMLVAFVAMFIVGVRALSGEDDWICRDGQWIEHGHPDFPAPANECK